MVSTFALHAINRDEIGATDGLCHLVADGQFNADSMSSLCGIVVGPGNWEFPINDVSIYMLPLCGGCREASRGG